MSTLNDFKFTILVKSIKFWRYSRGFADQNIVGTVAFLPWLAKLAPEYTGYSKGLRYLGAPDKLLQDILKDHMETYEAGRERDFIDVALSRIYNESDPDSPFYKQVGCKCKNVLDLIEGGAVMEMILSFSDQLAVYNCGLVFCWCGHAGIHAWLGFYLFGVLSRRAAKTS